MNWNTNDAVGKCPIQNGLRDISMEDYWRNPLVVCETAERKMRGLPIDRARFPALADQVVDALHLLQAVALRNYGAISMRAFHDVLAALDHFLVLRDDCDDSRVDGYADDAGHLNEVFARHTEELEIFRRWFHERN
jgi:hypothetical protein